MQNMQTWVNGNFRRAILVEPHVGGARVTISEGDCHTFSTATTLEGGFRECLKNWPNARKRILLDKEKSYATRIIQSESELSELKRLLKETKKDLKK